jgi:quinoprotein glucose dehydrogenase
MLRASPIILPLAVLAASFTGAESQAPVGGGVPANLPSGAGRDLFVQGCSGCHAIGLATGKRRTPEEWTAVIRTMIAQGAQIDADQARAIHGYLAANFAPKDSPVTAALSNPPQPPSNKVYPRPAGVSQWPAYGGGNANTNFSSLTQITPANVSKLKQAWVYRYGAGIINQGDQGIDYRFEVTPLLIGDVMYFSTPASPATPDIKASVTALRPETGELLWKYESPLNIHGRGIAYWPGDEQTAPRLIFATDAGMIVAVDVTTGRPARGFGLRGQIDAYIGVSSEIVGESRRRTYTVPNPVLIYKDLIITGSRPGEDGPPGPRGDIRAFDARTGRLVWEFHTIPQPGEPGHEVYSGDQWRGLTGANVWSTMSADDEAGVIYAVTGDANAPSGVQGSQLYSSSLLAIDAKSGKLKWYHQITHHDIWDWDSPTPVVLLNVTQNGQAVPAVAVTGKHSLFFMFDRRTGAPLNGFTERPTPQPVKPDPNVWPTQPFPDAPGPLARVQMTRDEIPDLVPGMRTACQAIWDKYNTTSDPLYAPRRAPDHAVITYPSSVGGPNWGGGSYNPDLHLYFINVQNRVTFTLPGEQPLGMGHESPDDSSLGDAGARSRPPRRGSFVPPFSFTTPDATNLSCGALPWSELVAVNTETRKIAWRVPLGITEGIGAKGLTAGTGSIGGNMATKSGLIFIGATNDRRFRAFDAKTGRKLWEATLDASAAATPISYMGKDGKQYVVVAAGGGTSVGQKQMADTLVAYRLP